MSTAEKCCMFLAVHVRTSLAANLHLLICWLTLKRETRAVISLTNCVWRINDSVMIQIWDVAFLDSANRKSFFSLFFFNKIIWRKKYEYSKQIKEQLKKTEQFQIRHMKDANKSSSAFLSFFFSLALAPHSFQVMVDPDQRSFSPLDRAQRQTHFLLH